MRACLSLSIVVALFGCSDEKTSSRTIAAYESTDPCSAHGDEASCTADTAGGCSWIALGIACPDGTDCPSGVCQELDDCRGHADQSSCEADAACAWAAVELCPAGGPCPDGYCYPKEDGCTCVCPLYCPAGAECPPCECDCPPDPGGGGGDDCTCVCPDCPPGESCLPCDCSCDGGGGGSCGGGTCTCACETCVEGESCPPCDCTCEDAPTGTSVPIAVDPCSTWTDEASCFADTANACTWYAIGAPCIEGEPCISGVCQGPSDPGCTCVCPECAPGETCPPCDCGATGGSAGGGSSGP